MSPDWSLDKSRWPRSCYRVLQAIWGSMDPALPHYPPHLLCRLRHPHDAHGREDRSEQSKDMDMDKETQQLPLGVCARTIHLALITIKPFEHDPRATMIIAELPPSRRAQRRHGTVPTANAIRAVSFVGGNGAGKHIYELGTKNGKRVQCNIGAKNHAVVMPYANKDQALNALLWPACGAAGQRCMAISVGGASVNMPVLRVLVNRS
ncbi:Aldehyde/histidinol dehydrogenase [Mycena galopus ATCC 62051]|nr:Aldehyde/histidinol dehydrogenase [Mycena galopus ATCC 62051]